MSATGEEPDAGQSTPEPPKRWKSVLTGLLIVAIPAATSLIALFDSGPDTPPPPPATSVSGTPPR